MNEREWQPEWGCGPPDSWFLPLSSASGDNNIYEVMPSPVFLVSPGGLSGTGLTKSLTVSPTFYSDLEPLLRVGCCAQGALSCSSLRLSLGSSLI